MVSGDPGGEGPITDPESVGSGSPQTSPESEGETGLSAAAARDVIQSWQTIKAAGRGKNHEFAKFKDILLNPQLSLWTRLAKQDQAAQTYWEYELHQLEVESVETLNETQAVVLVEITESGNQVIQGRVGDQSYDKDQYRVRYNLSKQNDQWRIMNWDVL